ncbi:hypothetical protein [Streptomyces sp. NPDC093568]|uniref:hypothetical protein n=1 Tax=Streptomyces sp. NPDC093568 TaxID=3366041 RepID=UPI00381D4767
MGLAAVFAQFVRLQEAVEFVDEAESGYGVVEPVPREGQPATALRGCPHREFVQQLDPHEPFHSAAIDLVEALGAAQVEQDLQGVAAQTARTMPTYLAQAGQCLVAETLQDGFGAPFQGDREALPTCGNSDSTTWGADGDQAVLRGLRRPRPCTGRGPRRPRRGGESRWVPAQGYLVGACRNSLASVVRGESTPAAERCPAEHLIQVRPPPATADGGRAGTRTEAHTSVKHSV